jgi:hypothetical protein
MNRMSCRVVALLGVSGWIASPAFAHPEGEAGNGEKTIEQLSAIKAVSPALVVVQVHLQTDKGQSPSGGDFSMMRRMRSAMSSFDFDYNDFDSRIKEKRPLESAGYAVSPTTFVCRDMFIHPRFIKEIRVAAAGKEVPARIAGYYLDQPVLRIEIDAPIAGVTPLEVSTDAKEPFKTITYGESNGAWTVTTGGFAGGVATSQNGWQYRPASGGPLVVDKLGSVAGLWFRDRLPTDESWKGGPDGWPEWNADDMTARLKRLETAAGRAIVRVKLSFRSPRKGAEEDYGMYNYGGGGGGGDAGATERNVAGVLVAPDRVLVLANLKPKVTARLERVVVHPEEGNAVTAVFEATFKDDGAFLARLEAPLEGVAALSDRHPYHLADELLLAADITFQGEQRVAYFDRCRVEGFAKKWEGRIYPGIRGNDTNRFVFDANNHLVTIPITRRASAAEENTWYENTAVSIPAKYVLEQLATLDDHADPNNIPLTEEQENRLAWLGVEMQALDQELARINNVSDLTRDGSIGAMVSYVYPDSPASRAELQSGDILLRLHVVDEPKPVEVQVDRYGMMFGGGGFPWDQLDQLPEQMFDRVPKPWPPAETNFTRTLTDLGFGRAFKAEIYRDGKVIERSFVIEQSPPHFDSTPNFKSEPLGITVRNLTYEVRRYFQKNDEDEGVIVSTLEPGGKCSTAGIKPYEIVTKVNDEPVMNIEQFEKLVTQEADELRFEVKRMHRGRIVKIKMPKTDAKSEKEEKTDTDDSE